MDMGTFLLVALAGFLGGTVNAVVGSGTLVVYPTLLAAGLSPIIANGSNTAGLSVGSFSSAYAYRRELVGRMRQLTVPLIVVVFAAACGASLVIVAPEQVFVKVVPWLILSAAVLVALQPLLTKYLRGRSGTGHRERPVALALATGATGVYGGYFGAGQGVVLMGILSAFYDADLQKSNGAKNLLAATANVTAAVVFALSGRVLWWAAIIVAIGAFFGGTAGAVVARKLPSNVLRGCVVAVGVIAALSIFVRH